MSQRSRSAASRSPIRLHDDALEQLLGHCREEWPREACGLLLGEGACVRAVAAARNVAPGDQRSSFEIDPRDFVAADVAARERGLEIVGSYHSHPVGAAEPSAQDRAAAQPGWWQLIVGRPQHARPELRSYRLLAGRLAEEAIESRA